MVVIFLISACWQRHLLVGETLWDYVEKQEMQFSLLSVFFSPREANLSFSSLGKLNFIEELGDIQHSFQVSVTVFKEMIP